MIKYFVYLWFTRYYYSEFKNIEAKILLSDFTLDGYRMSKDKGNLSLEHCIKAGRYNNF